MGRRRKKEQVDVTTTETFEEGMWPSGNLRGHLTFDLKHEVAHLKMTSRIFKAQLLKPQLRLLRANTPETVFSQRPFRRQL